MKSLFVFAVCLAMFCSASVSYTYADVKISHYEGETVKTKQDAMDMFRDKTGEIDEIMDRGDLGEIELEAIHQLSYSLENAIDTLIALQAYPSENMELVDEAVQALHHASENHEGAETRRWFRKLGERYAQIDKNLGVEAADISADDEPKKLAAVLDTTHTIVIKNHQFTPDEIRVPAGEKIKLIVDNQDPTPEEFESDDLRREKIIAGNSKATVMVGPMKPGKYRFFGEFNLDTANGYIVAE